MDLRRLVLGRPPAGERGARARRLPGRGHGRSRGCRAVQVGRGGRPARVYARSLTPGFTDDIGERRVPDRSLPLAQLNALSTHQRRRAARTRGFDWPTTDRARDRLEDTLIKVIRQKDYRVVDAPTSLGKTHSVAVTRWAARDALTGDHAVVHLLQTRGARDEAREVARGNGATPYSDSSLLPIGVVDLAGEDGKIASSPYGTPIRGPSRSPTPTTAAVGDGAVPTQTRPARTPSGGGGT